MNKYQKPQIAVLEFSIDENIASLNEWLTSNSLTDAGITTYVINS